ncbi:hypothetical protein STVIR_0425 [Streptomyces viridochromogenes Tue57]|uniref:Uncharacterized protein n=1 Tax=Streptomyces viridochromogenes Tue57 TaxID=1160705 RepID=L8PTI6_STRVR|nr:hypothetical protein STVIR_0425 [Streptomyces viridochromogenes Tue57]
MWLVAPTRRSRESIPPRAPERALPLTLVKKD